MVVFKHWRADEYTESVAVVRLEKGREHWMNRRSKEEGAALHKTARELLLYTEVVSPR